MWWSMWGPLSHNINIGLWATISMLDTFITSNSGYACREYGAESSHLVHMCCNSFGKCDITTIMLLLVRTSWYRVAMTWRSDERYHGRDEHHDGAQSLKSHWFMALTWQENLLCHALVRYMFTWTENAWRPQSIFTRHDSWVHVMSTLTNMQSKGDALGTWFNKFNN